MPTCAPCELDSASTLPPGPPSESSGSAALALPRSKEEARQLLTSMLTLHCPNPTCRHAVAMDDHFDACFSLSCSRCSGQFCAWCFRLAAEGEDPHTHVLDCPSAPEDMLGSALYLQEHSGGPHEPPRPKRKFVAHWRRVHRARGMELLRRMAEADVERYDAARDEPELMRLLDLHLVDE